MNISTAIPDLALAPATKQGGRPWLQILLGVILAVNEYGWATFYLFG
jgi:hypothetical protein